MIRSLPGPTWRAGLAAAVAALFFTTIPPASDAQEAAPFAQAALAQVIEPTATPTQATGTTAADPVDPDDADRDEQAGDADQADGVEVKRGLRNNARNVVALKNTTDGKLRVRGRVDLAQIKGTVAAPDNESLAYASCTDCQTFTVALQIALVTPYTKVAVPRNLAKPTNVGCTRCITVARATQYVITVDDVEAVPPRVEELVQALDKELRAIHAESSQISAREANTRITNVVAQFNDLAASLIDQSEEAAEASTTGGTPTATATPAAPPEATATPTAIASP
jgi:hypothetical protein